MFKIIGSVLLFLLGGKRVAKVLRLPESEAELHHAYEHHDSLNGRYYLYADIVVEPDIYMMNVLFDADTMIAIHFAASETEVHLSDLFGRKIIASLIVYSTMDYPQQRATMEERDDFEQQWKNTNR